MKLLINMIKKILLTILPYKLLCCFRRKMDLTWKNSVKRTFLTGLKPLIMTLFLGEYLDGLVWLRMDQKEFYRKI